MLIAIDLQNDYLDPAGKFFVPASASIIEPIMERLSQAVNSDELIIYTKNIYPESEYYVRSAEEISWAEEIFPPFQKLLHTAECFEKKHYGIAPEEALRFQEKYQSKEHAFDRIEFVGVETNVCVLANMAIIQNIFTKSMIILNPKLSAARDAELFQAALKVMQGLKMELIEENHCKLDKDEEIVRGF